MTLSERLLDMKGRTALPVDHALLLEAAEYVAQLEGNKTLPCDVLPAILTGVFAHGGLKEWAGPVDAHYIKNICEIVCDAMNGGELT